MPGLFAKEKTAIHNAAKQVEPLVTLVTIALVLSALALVIVAIHVSEH